MGDKSDVKRKEEGVDLVTLAIGEFGRFQALICGLHSFTCALFLWQIFANKFLASEVDFTCSNQKYVFNQTSTDDQRCFQLQEGEVQPCEQFDFSEATYRNTITERFNLACTDSQTHLLRLAQSLFFVGTLIGALTCGPVTDKYGRRLVYVGSLGLSGVSSAMSLFASNFTIWVTGRLLSGVFSMAVTLSSNVYKTEVFGGRWRSIGNAIGAAIPAQFGHLSLALYVYLVPDLYWLEVILAVSGLASIPYWFLIPESPRWLKVQGRGEESLQVIRKISKMNRISHNYGEEITTYCLNENVKNEKQQQDELNNNKGKIKMVKKYPALCRNMLVCTLLWFSFNIGFYGMVYNTPPLDFSPQMVFAFPAFFTLPIVAISPFLENKLGRKALIIFPLGLAGITAILTLAIPFESTWIVIALCTISTVAAFEALNVSYTYTKEIFPTVMRGTALSFSSTFGRLGAIAAPLLLYLTPPSAPGDSVLTRLPLGAYGVFMIVAAISCLWLWPETTWTTIPDSLEEGEAAARSHNPWVSWCYCNSSGNVNNPKLNVDDEEVKESDNMLA